MEFREFIRKPFVIYEEEQPVVPQPEPEQPRILTPSKKLILPAQPKREKPQGFEPREPRGPMRVDQFPNRIRDPYVVNPDFDKINDEQLKKYRQLAYEEVLDHRQQYEDDEDREDKINQWVDETEDMDIKEVMQHNNFAFKHYVMGNELSDYLRQGDSRFRNGFDMPRYEYFMKTMANVLSDEAGDIPDEVWRGLSWNAKDAFKDLKPGQIISDPGFMSTATEKYGTASEFGPDNGGIMMNLRNAGGKGAIDMDYWGDNEQSEMVFPPNTALQYEGNDDKDYYFNILEPSFDDIDKYGNVSNYGEVDKEYRKELGFLESRKPLKLLNKMKDKLREAFQQRMNDFQFQVLDPEEQEEKPEPKQFRDVLKKMIDPDD
jgi:hypothetical protein